MLSRGRTSHTSPITAEYEAEAEFVSEARHNFGSLNNPEHGKQSQFYPTHREPKQGYYGSRSVAAITNTAILTGLFMLIAIVLGLGVLFNGTSVIPHYQPDYIVVDDNENCYR